MAFKLKDLIITKVDFVDAGANQRANIAITKHAPKGGDEMGKEKSKLETLISAIAKKLGVGGESEEVQKRDARTFNDVNAELNKRKVYEQIWDVTDALRSSLISIINDDEVQDKGTMLKESIDQFSVVAKKMADSWNNGQTVQLSLNIAQEDVTDCERDIAKRRLESMIGVKNDPEPTPAAEEEVKKSIETKEDNSMSIDKSKMTPAELAFFNDIEKRYSVNEEPEKATETVAKNEPAPEKTAEEVLKGLNPALTAVLERMQNIEKKAEEKEFLEIAKKYEILGEKAEELAPVLKSAKEASQEAYDLVIKQLDKAVEVTNKSGVFDEIGKRGSEDNVIDNESKVEKFAQEIMKSKPDMSVYEARDLVYQQHPELIG